MCGICGRLNFNGASVDKDILLKMCGVIKHRGPDSEGVYQNPEIRIQKSDIQVGLGIRRLAIIDLQTGDQPIHNEDKSIWIVSNSEIYNFQELRNTLEKQGHTFYTRTDTEVIVHLYENYGVNCLKHLRGMFAFALWDGQKKQLFIARDRVGKKPLCYTRIGGAFIFASELKSILENPEIKREIDFSALNHYLTYQYIPAPMTIFSGISKLPPASFLICDRQGNIKIERYWDLNYRNKLNLTESEYCQRIMDLLEESTRIRLVSDVPLGALLSGGIDSSAVVGMMAKHMNQPVKTFSIGFEEEEYSEIQHAKIIARHFKTNHYEFIVKPQTIEILPRLIWHYNEPYADSSMLPTYYVAKETRRHVTVALNGDGGDESFAGYPRYQAYKLTHFYNLLSRFLDKKYLTKFVDLIPVSKFAGHNNFFRRLKRLTGVLSLSPELRYLYWVSIFNNEQKKHLCTDSFLSTVKQTNSDNYLTHIFLNAGTDEFLDRILYTDVMTYLPEDLLVKMDIAAMANSLEARSPFLDHHLMEFAARIPSGLKLKRLTSKYILKKALRGFLPSSILHRKKMGFGLPISNWFRGKLKGYIKGILLSEKSIGRGYFKRQSLEQLIEEHISGVSDHAHRLWALLTLELWHRIFIDREKI